MWNSVVADHRSWFSVPAGMPIALDPNHFPFLTLGVERIVPVSAAGSDGKDRQTEQKTSVNVHGKHPLATVVGSRLDFFPDVVSYAGMRGES